MPRTKVHTKVKRRFKGRLLGVEKLEKRLGIVRSRKYTLQRSMHSRAPKPADTTLRFPKTLQDIDPGVSKAFNARTKDIPVTKPGFVDERYRLVGKDNIHEYIFQQSVARVLVRGKPSKQLTKSGNAGRKEIMEDRAKTNRLNKDRARRMENYVAKYLKGKRVPLSGAGRSWKGDVMVPLYVQVDDKRYEDGMMIVECKMTAKLRYNRPAIIFKGDEWFDQLENEVYVTRAKLGTIVLHFHDTPFYCALLTEEAVRKLLTYDCDRAILEYMLSSPTTENWSYISTHRGNPSMRKDNSVKYSPNIMMFLDAIENAMKVQFIQDSAGESISVRFAKISLYINKAEKTIYFMPLYFLRDLMYKVLSAVEV
jgi:hypothetical protein